MIAGRPGAILFVRNHLFLSEFSFRLDATIFCFIQYLSLRKNVSNKICETMADMLPVDIMNTAPLNKSVIKAREDYLQHRQKQKDKMDTYILLPIASHMARPLTSEMPQMH